MASKRWNSVIGGKSEIDGKSVDGVCLSPCAKDIRTDCYCSKPIGKCAAKESCFDKPKRCVTTQMRPFIPAGIAPVPAVQIARDGKTDPKRRPEVG